MTLDDAVKILIQHGYRGCHKWYSTRPDGQGSVVGDREFLIISPEEAIRAAERRVEFEEAIRACEVCDAPADRRPEGMSPVSTIVVCQGEGLRGHHWPPEVSRWIRNERR